MRSEHTKWVMLALAAFTIMGSYYTYDSIAPVAGLLRDERGLSQSQIGLLNAVFNLPNIALALIGGIIIDRIGAAKAILIAASICTIGAVLTAVGEPFGLMLFGRLLFGLGNETLYIALLVGIAQWFHLGGGALAIALFFSMARVGSYSADKSTSWFADVYAAGWQAPLWLAAGLTATGVFSALIYYLVDSRFPHLRAVGQKSERFMLKDLTGFSRSFWYILWLNVLFASVFFPFRSTFSIQYFMDVKGMNLAEAGTANSYAADFRDPRNYQLWSLGNYGPDGFKLFCYPGSDLACNSDACRKASGWYRVRPDKYDSVFGSGRCQLRGRLSQRCIQGRPE